jgi:hypothetical protein
MNRKERSVCRKNKEGNKNKIITQTNLIQREQHNMSSESASWWQTCSKLSNSYSKCYSTNGANSSTLFEKSCFKVQWDMSTISCNVPGLNTSLKLILLKYEIIICICYLYASIEEDTKTCYSESIRSLGLDSTRLVCEVA